MFEILLTACLLTDPGACRTARYPGGNTLSECDWAAISAAFELSDGERAVRWPCVATGEDTYFGASHVAPGVYVHKGQHAEAAPGNGGDLANMGFVIGQRAVAVIDAGGSAEIAEALLTEIRARTDLPITHLILTHMHPDHILGMEVFRAAGAEVVGHAKLPAAVSARTDTYMEAMQALIGARFARTLPPGAIAPAPEEIDLGGRTLQIESYPTAHTDNDLSVRDSLTGTWFLGDLLFAGHLPAIDGSINGWLGLIERLQGVVARRVVPGHGPVAMDWPAAAEPMRAYLDGLRTAVRADIAAGTPMLEAIESDRPDLTQGWLLTDSFHRRNVSTAYQELEWE